MEIREIEAKDLEELLRLYTQLHGNEMPELNNQVRSIWDKILRDQNHRIFVGEVEGRIVSSCVLVIIHNLTRCQRPYALVENMITDATYRKRGFATALLQFAKDAAIKEGCYKIMLLTGSKEESTLDFYERAGFNRTDKTGFIQWL
ncbi:MAG: GNAT family N-acetyltransferase [Eubacteriales bacterium]